MTVKRMAVVDVLTGDVENVIVYDDALSPDKQWPTPAGKQIWEDAPAKRGVNGTPNPRESKWDAVAKRFREYNDVERLAKGLPPLERS